MKRKFSAEEQSTSTTPIDGEPDNGSSPKEETVDLDDLCPICHSLIYKPVRTRCNHTLCQSCMALWADVSVTSQLTAVGLDDEVAVMLPHEIETRCPMCRTFTISTLDPTRESELQRLYPASYQAREAESQTAEEDGSASTIETLTIHIGNEHTEIRADQGSNNKHHWKFFIRPSRTDLIEEVQLFLHPTFRNPIVVIEWPPYEIRRLGWGFFTIYANIILKPGYSWVSPEAEGTRDGAPKGKLPLEWTLDFNGRGSQARIRLKVRNEKEGQEAELDIQRERVRRSYARQRETDRDWEDT